MSNNQCRLNVTGQISVRGAEGIRWPWDFFGDWELIIGHSARVCNRCTLATGLDCEK